ncbi:MAG: phosphoribosylamine--glycine ligase [Clostridiales bacterium]|jgi:phosphoribosylamine--glycine ligase|nr:phosphoribosylamine--glycine ligase [Clostridiales bacterium]
MKKRNILVIGGGGREHAIVHKLSQSRRVGKIYALPGNAGIAALAECHPEIAAINLPAILMFVRSHPDIYMTVVAPDDPLSMGLVDRLDDMCCRVFGPKKKAAEIESSKVFAKNLMKKYGIPTAAYEVFDDYQAADRYLETCAYPTVIKADGLALGKGVIICPDMETAKAGLKNIMKDAAFGSAGSSVVIEEFLTGFEVSVLAFCDGKTVLPMASSQDHKRAFDGDRGPNTGGMGAFCPSDKYTPALAAKAYETIFLPTVAALNAEGREFKGVIYFGLMINGDDIRVLEYNARFGDPETQAVLPRLKNDLFEIFEACINGALDKITLEYVPDYSVCVVAASRGYPLAYEKGKVISLGNLASGVHLYHAGTIVKDNRLVTNGGRVFGVTALGPDMESARQKAYDNMKGISFEGMFFRTDIGLK